ncbi:MAG: phosphate signaling complex protein PhoU [Anaerolineae bacterium]|jgi:phosphate transport system protein
MTRQTFDQELQRLEDEVLSMGKMVGNALIRSVASLKAQDLDASRALIAADAQINQRRFSLEEEVLTLIATQQPMAGDMRLLAAVLEILTELERIGDYAKGIARINLMIGDEPLIKPLVDLPVMAQKANDMLHDALQAFRERNVELARAIPGRDDEVDNLYDQIYRELISYILENPTTIEQANLLMWAAHNLERTADRTINLCERVIFMVTGELSELDSDARGLPGVS